MNVNELRESKYLKKEDCPIAVTIKGVKKENVGLEGDDPRWILFFNEVAKGLVLNSTNGQTIAEITGSPESDAWVGKRIDLYNDPNVSFSGKRTGGIRVKAVSGNVAAPTRSVEDVNKELASVGSGQTNW